MSGAEPGGGAPDTSRTISDAPRGLIVRGSSGRGAPVTPPHDQRRATWADRPAAIRAAAGPAPRRPPPPGTPLRVSTDPGGDATLRAALAARPPDVGAPESFSPDDAPGEPEPARWAPG